MTDHNEDFVSFEKALRELKLQSEELKKLVSEGEIRAFRDGQSMKFKREDVENLSVREEEPDEIMFADVLEDDTGMVTEELSDDETLLAEDDLLADEPEPEAPRRSAAAATRRSSRAPAEDEVETHEPGWVTAAAILGAAIMLYGVMVMFSIAAEQAPSGLTSIFAK